MRLGNVLRRAYRITVGSFLSQRFATKLDSLGLHALLTDSLFQIDQLEARLQLLDAHFRERTEVLETYLSVQKKDSVLFSEIVCDALRNLTFLMTAQAEASKLLDISLVVTSHNRVSELKRCLKSVVLCQEIPSEIIIVFDGEDFRNEIEDLSKTLQSRGARVSLLKTKSRDSGPCAARNLGLEHAKQPYIAYLDDDCLTWPTWYSSAVKFLDNHKNFDLVYGAQLRSDWRGKLLFRPWDQLVIEDFRSANFIDTNMFVHRKNDLLFEWDESLPRLTDWKFLRDSLFNGADFSSLAELSSIYTLSDVSITRGYDFGISADILRINESGSTALKFCNICNLSSTFSNGPNGRPTASCDNCGSLERHRLFRLLLQNLIKLFDDDSNIRVLECAPGSYSSRLFDLDERITYKSFDSQLNPDNRDIDFSSDITDMRNFESESVEVFYISHVLEHVEDDGAAMVEIERLLSRRGIAIVQVPLSQNELTIEGSISDPLERRLRYGQEDHVRLYGLDILNRFEKSNLTALQVNIDELFPRIVIEGSAIMDKGATFLLFSNLKMEKENQCRLISLIESAKKGWVC